MSTGTGGRSIRTHRLATVASSAGSDLGQEHEDRRAGRLFQRLQQHGGGQPGQVDVLDADDLTVAFERAALGQPYHPAGVVDAHGSSGPPELHQVGMRSRQCPAAHRALPTTSERAQKRRCETSDQGALAQTGFTHQHIGVHRATRRGPQLGYGPVLADDVGEQRQRRPVGVNSACGYDAPSWWTRCACSGERAETGHDRLVHPVGHFGHLAHPSMTAQRA